MKDVFFYWFMQRFSALCMLFCFYSFMNVSLLFFNNMSVNFSYFTLIFFSLFMYFSLYHGYLGMLVIVDDYIHCKSMLILFKSFLRIIMFLSLFEIILFFVKQVQII